VGGRVVNVDHVTPVRRHVTLTSHVAPVSLDDLRRVRRRLAERHFDDVIVAGGHVVVGAPPPRRPIHVRAAQVRPRRPRDPRRKRALRLRPTEHV